MRHPRFLVVLTAFVLLRCGGPIARGQTNWPQFRGPNAAGVSTNLNVPDKWSATENVVWKTDLPGRSWSSPIVWGETRDR